MHPVQRTIGHSLANRDKGRLEAPDPKGPNSPRQRNFFPILTVDFRITKMAPTLSGRLFIVLLRSRLNGHLQVFPQSLFGQLPKGLLDIQGIGYPLQSLQAAILVRAF